MSSVLGKIFVSKLNKFWFEFLCKVPKYLNSLGWPDNRAAKSPPLTARGGQHDTELAAAVFKIYLPFGIGDFHLGQFAKALGIVIY